MVENWTIGLQRSKMMSLARLAGQVLRYHTWPVLRQQSVAEHLWQQMRIYYQIWGPLPPEVSTYILWSDVGEFHTGDLPFPVKARNPVLKSEADRIEHQAVVQMGGPEQLALLPAQKVQVKLCDLLEMWEFGLCEANLGNRFARPVVDDIWATVDVLRKELTPDLDRPLAAYIRATANKLEF